MPPANSVSRILLIDDQRLVRDGLASLLSSRAELEVVGEAGTAEEGIAALERLKPDLLIIDLRLPDADGRQVLTAAWKVRWKTYVIVLSGLRSDDELIAATRAGARAYLTKSASGREVLAAIERVLAGENLLAAALDDRLRNRVQQRELTARETEILALIGRGLTNKEICRRKHISANTVKAHLRNVFAKLNVANRTQAASVAAQRGLNTR